jgi:carboxylesterase type B
MSGTECLNLNITVPSKKLVKLIPVLVFIHGGGLVMGANYWPHYDSRRLVELACEAGMPVVVVGMK